jgi:hypothetical protein
MAANSSFMIADAERHFPVRIRIGVRQDGLGSPLNQIKAWLDENCGANGWMPKKAALEQSAPDPARRLFPSEGLSLRRRVNQRGGTAFPACIRIGISPDGLSSRLDRIRNGATRIAEERAGR